MKSALLAFVGLMSVHAFAAPSAGDIAKVIGNKKVRAALANLEGTNVTMGISSRAVEESMSSGVEITIVTTQDLPDNQGTQNCSLVVDLYVKKGSEVNFKDITDESISFGDSSCSKPYVHHGHS